MKTKLIQQGDVLFHSVGKLATGMKRVKAEAGRLVFARGEATGHHHSVVEDCGVELYQDEAGVLWCSVVNPHGAVVEHQEHKPVKLDQGVYKIGIVREVDPFSEEIRSVKD